MSLYQSPYLSLPLAPELSNSSEKKLLADVVNSVFAVVRPPNHQNAPGYLLVTPEDKKRLQETEISRLLPWKDPLACVCGPQWAPREPVVRFSLETYDPPDPSDNPFAVEKTGRVASKLRKTPRKVKAPSRGMKEKSFKTTKKN
ncbi:hypothetical protein RUND412_006985, partial [Rhizina undulata]